MSTYFAMIRSSITCTKCQKRANQARGKAQIRMIKFPRYLLLFIDQLDSKGCLRHPIKQHNEYIDLTKYAATEALEEGQELKYVLTAMVAHPQNTDPVKGMYQAIVRRTIDGEKQWVKFHFGEWKVVKDKKAFAHPAQILFYELVS